MIHFDNVKLIYAKPSSSAGHLRCCVFIIISVSAIAKKKKKKMELLMHPPEHGEHLNSI